MGLENFIDINPKLETSETDALNGTLGVKLPLNFSYFFYSIMSLDNQLGKTSSFESTRAVSAYSVLNTVRVNEKVV